MKKTRRFWLILPFFLCIICILLARCTLARERRERKLLPLVTTASAEFDVPVAMILAVIRTESNFREDAVSSAGARGLMQLMPETFLWLTAEKLCEELPDKRIAEPAVNIRYGTYYLDYLYRRFGDWPTALAAYNAGEGNVTEWLQDPVLAPNGRLLTIPFSETDAYVNSVLRAYQFYQQKYG